MFSSAHLARKDYTMANELQLAILKQGVEVWNDWREQNPEECVIDLSDVVSTHR